MKSTLVAAIAASLLASSSISAQQVKIDADTFAGIEARSIGPAAMSGRISAIDAVSGDRLTIYAGSAGGGLWKSIDGGVRFRPVFDKYNQSIGAVTIDPRTPNTVWVGTGETWTRNSVSVGDGIYKSTDAGESWTKMGLADTERIARIAVNPKDSRLVYACAVGHLFDDNPERGVFRTKDGGATWEKVLYVAPDTGCADLALDPENPAIIYASLWQVRRRPDFFTSGGPHSGFFKSSDGGNTWQPIKKGLREGDIGRVAIAIAPSKPATVYAAVESRKSALYRSDDRGETWTEVSTSSVIGQRPFYFSRLVVDPTDPNRIYKMGLLLSMSEDGGKRFQQLGMGQSYHSDVHDIWINRAHPADVIIGTDGGVFMSHDRGSDWRFVGSLPVSQFYHVSYDMAWPYNVYGGLQDNSTWYGPSRRSGGIGNRHWQSLTPGDGFWAFADPTDVDVIYGEMQGGNLFRIRRSTLETKDISPAPREGDPKLRFNWNTPIHISATTPGVIYYGAQFLFKSADKGESWERISPDLTTNDPEKQRHVDSGGLTPDDSSAENHCTIYAISQSPLNAGVIWVGTDDGNLQVTRDGGGNWKNVVGAIPGLPKGTWVSSVDAGHFAEGVAYATFDGHMTGDMKTYVYKTTDFGQTWTALAQQAPSGLRGYAHVVKEDLSKPSLLFVGTEFGLFVSIDGGVRWAPFGSGIPPVAVRDLAIHPRESDLIVATHGRGIYIVDDITPLRTVTPEVLDSDAAFLGSRPVVMTMPVSEFSFAGDGEFVARPPLESASINYYLKERHAIGDLHLEIYDSAGTMLASIGGGKRRGINRVEWPIRTKAPQMAPGMGIVPSIFAMAGPRVLEGTYKVKLLIDGRAIESAIRLAPDPRSTQTSVDRAAQHEAVLKAFGMVEQLASLVNRIDSVAGQARSAMAKLPPADRLARQLDAFVAVLGKDKGELVSTRQTEGISNDEKLREQLGLLYGNINGYEGRPTASQTDRMNVLGKRLAAAVDAFNHRMSVDLPPINRELAKRKIDQIMTK